MHGDMGRQGTLVVSGLLVACTSFGGATEPSSDGGPRTEDAAAADAPSEASALGGDAAEHLLPNGGFEASGAQCGPSWIGSPDFPTVLTRDSLASSGASSCRVCRDGVAGTFDLLSSPPVELSATARTCRLRACRKE